uniref:Uncharacterized protein n=1 Tax=Panagrolaimus sp. JU765 TaxID=591449 RepID=A0AC34PY85_9BILA
LIMKLIRKQAHLPPITLFVSKMDEACPSMAFSQQTSNDPLFLIVGTSKGEAIFYPISNQTTSQPITKFVSENQSPITAIAEGCLRDPKIKEIITIHANGLTHLLDYPKELDGPLKTFSQQIYANVNTCRILDIDGDKICELLVMLTDRVGQF